MARVFKSAWFVRFSRKEKIADHQLLDVAHRVKDGMADVELGGGVFKQRLTRPGRGKSGGYRLIILFRAGKSIFFVYCFAKKDLANLRSNEVEMFKKMASHLFALSDEQLDALIANGQFQEVLENDEKI